MKTITWKGVKKLQADDSMVWFEGVSTIPKEIYDCFNKGMVRYWEEGKSYIIRSKKLPSYWCITKDYFDKYWS